MSSMESAPHHIAVAPSKRRSSTGHWGGIVNFLVRRRVSISATVFAALLFEDIMMGFKPHDVTNIRDAYTCSGLALVFSGLALRMWAAGTLRKGIELTTTGIYQLVRNPLYVGSFMLMLGFTVFIDDPENIFFVLGPILLLYRLKVRREEQTLAARYGAAWHAYACSTPRFFPRRLSTGPFSGWSAQQWMTSREYNATAAALASLVALKLWHLT